MPIDVLAWAINAPIDDPTVFRTLVVLANHADASGFAFPYIDDTLAPKVRRSKRTVRNALDTLDDEDYIERVRVKIGGSYRGYLYRVLCPGVKAVNRANLPAWVPDDIELPEGWLEPIHHRKPVTGGQRQPTTGGHRKPVTGQGLTTQGEPPKDEDPSPSDLRPDEEWATDDTDIETVKATARSVATMIADNGHPLPTRGTKAHRTWLIEMDRLLRLGPAGQTTVDPPTPDQVIAVARWATSDSFWASNIQSIPKLRDKWSQLALKARRTANGNGQPTGLDAVAAYANRMADR